ncbi:MAG: hypothetical protein A2X94_00585 [Bdellovibrionales bacterium GWB1_55_8]|nr:MAG: hypothetical protein A2X94_00585 [Bdellovibrionales bacterium GWB1_55_8]
MWAADRQFPGFRRIQMATHAIFFRKVIFGFTRSLMAGQATGDHFARRISMIKNEGKTFLGTWTMAFRAVSFGEVWRGPAVRRRERNVDGAFFLMANGAGFRNGYMTEFLRVVPLCSGIVTVGAISPRTVFEE